MEHHEVQDTMNRTRTPIIEIRVKLRLEHDDRQNDTYVYRLLVWLDNKGAVAAKHIKLILEFPEPLSADFQLASVGT